MGSNEALFQTLLVVHEHGGVAPSWDARSDRGFTYQANGREIDRRDLEALARREYLESIFVDRISRCPACKSHHLNMREVCVACKSPHIEPLELLHHFRCGYVAPTGAFVAEIDGRRCPKCHGILRDRGTDHDVPGPQFTCNDCGISFQLPEIGALCLSCGRHTQGDALASIVYEDVHRYKLTPFGLSAVRRGALLGDEAEQLRRLPDLILSERNDG